MNSLNRTARLAGVLYLLLSIIGPFNLIYIPDAFIVRGDASATAANIRASESLYRLGIAMGLIGDVVFILVVITLYHLFEGVNRRHAALMATFALVAVPMSFVATLCQIAPLVLLSGASFLSPFDTRQLDALALTFLNLRGSGISALSVYWGLWLFPFALLVIRSGFIPRVIGVLLLIAGAAYVTSSLASLLLPASRPFLRYMMIPESGELAIVFWLLIKGAGGAPAPARQQAAAG